MKTLLVKYLPSGSGSNTKKLLDLFLQQVKNENIEVVDLLKEELPIFNEASIQAYYKRNYNGQKLNEAEAKLLKKNDKLTAQLKSADILVMVCPMHNFSLPAAIKTWMDAVILKGETFDPAKKMMQGKKALTLYTSGGTYSEDSFNFNYPNWNSIILITKANFTYMGFDESEVIGTSLRDQATAGERLAEMGKKIKAVTTKWYGK